MSFKQNIGRILLKITGWKLIGQAPAEKNFILAVLLHTSYWDFFVGKMFNLYLGFPIFFMIKKEAFIFPLGYLLKMAGGVPVDRKKQGVTMLQILDRFGSGHQFVLSIAPEGTRKKVNHWKPGFWYFATKANVPIVPVGLNYKTKTAYIGEAIYMTNDRDSDFERLKNVYRTFDMHARYPDQFQL